MELSKMSGLELIRAMVRGEIPPATMAKTIPMTIARVDHGDVEFRVTANNGHLNPMGGVHGGFAATALDSVTGCAVHTTLGPGESYGTVDLNVKMLKPVPVDIELSAKGRVINVGKRIGVSEGVLSDDAGRIYAHATATCMIFR
ncbi:MAG: PaaI family thioesterase [Deltaproteobacteria bacterium]|nr:PaaI family thioesterase [Deltaproteobacteria bacterium]